MGVGNKNFPIAIIVDDWVDIHPKSPTKELILISIV